MTTLLRLSLPANLRSDGAERVTGNVAYMRRRGDGGIGARQTRGLA